jgi:hypothetical protein
MRGEIILQNGQYKEMIMREQGSTRLILCFDFQESAPQPMSIRGYRLECWVKGTLQRQAIATPVDALAAFQARAGELKDPSAERQRIMSQLTKRIDAGMCIHCGTSEHVLRALCAECRKLPQFQEVRGN